MSHTDAFANPIARTAANSADLAGTALSANVHKRYAAENDFVLDVDFTASAGFTIVFGSSGSGKTTLLNCIAGLCTPDSGAITVGAKSFYEAPSGRDVPVPQRNVGYVFQDLALFPHLTVEENVAYGLHRSSFSDRERRANLIMDAFRIGGLRKRRPDEISGGSGNGLRSLVPS